MKKVVVVIPARMKSVRLPGKPLRLIAGVPMVQRVYDRAIQCKGVSQVVVATEDTEIETFCNEHDIPVAMTGPQPSGTDRIAALAKTIQADLFVCIQGDEPLFDPKQMDDLLAVFEKHPEAQMAVLGAPATSSYALGTTRSKIAVAENGRALYFSRLPIPFSREGEKVERLYRVGPYGYTPAALEKFLAHGGESKLEKLEKLEQIRFLELGFDIYVGRSIEDSRSVDNEEDIKAVEDILADMSPDEPALPAIPAPTIFKPAIPDSVVEGERGESSWRKVNLRRVMSVHNKYAGKQIVILCSGPSVTPEQVALIKDHPYVMGVNGTYLLRDKFKFYSVVSNNFIEKNIEHVRKVDADHYFFRSQTRDFIALNTPFSKQSIYIEGPTFSGTMSDKGIGEVPLSVNLTGQIMWGPTVLLGLSLPAAIWMGFTDIVIIGADYPLQQDYKRFYTGQDNAPDQKYRSQDSFHIEMVESHRMAARWAEYLKRCHPEVKVWNCSPTSELTVFEKKELRSVLR